MKKVISILIMWSVPVLMYGQVLSPEYPAIYSYPLELVFSEIPDPAGCYNISFTATPEGGSSGTITYDGSGTIVHEYPVQMGFITQIQLDVGETAGSCEIDGFSIVNNTYIFEINSRTFMYGILTAIPSGLGGAIGQGVQPETFASTLFVASVAMMLYFFVFTIRKLKKSRGRL